MTMLDHMRRHKAWLKWSLGLVVVAFVLLYVPSFLKAGGPQSTDTIATVEGREIKAGNFRILYAQQVDAYRQAYGASLNDQLLKQLGIEQRLIQQMIDQEAVLAEAKRLNLTVTDSEVRARLLRLPSLQENGVFVGYDRYHQMLAMNRPPMTPPQFEEELRKNLLSEKVQAAVTGWVTVDDADVEKAYRDRNEKVKLELAVFSANNFRNGIDATDAELAAEFAANADAYKVGERRRVRFLSIDAQALRPKVTVTDAEVSAKYQQEIATYSTPETYRARHILMKTDGKNDEAVKKTMEGILAKAKAPGADFAKLATQYSDDEGSTDTGGEYDNVTHGQMVKEFDEAAWALKPGEISGLVKTQFGYHIIKLEEHKAASVKPLAQVKAQIEDQMRWEKAQAEAQKINDEVAPTIKTPADLDRIAQSRGLIVGDSGLFARDEPMAGIGFEPAVAAEAFTMKQDTVSGSLRTQRGFAFIALAEVQAPHAPKLEEVKAKVREDVIRKKAVELAKSKAAAVSQSKAAFAAAAKAAGVEVKTTELIGRGTALPEVGVSGVVDDAVFALPQGAVSQPIPTDTAVVVAHVVEKQAGTQDGLKAERDSIKSELLQNTRQEFFAAYMSKAKAKMKITINEATVKALIGG
jgi:peptidyl-prolyl cis-trans isomerase D